MVIFTLALIYMKGENQELPRVMFSHDEITHSVH